MNLRVKKVLGRLANAMAGLPRPEESEHATGLLVERSPDAEVSGDPKEAGPPVLLQILVGLAACFVSQYLAWGLFPASVPGPGCSWWQVLLTGFVSIRIGYFIANRLAHPRRREHRQP